MALFIRAHYLKIFHPLCINLCLILSCSFYRVATVDELKQCYVLMSADVKDAYMMHVLDTYIDANPKSSIMIFTNTCK